MVLKSKEEIKVVEENSELFYIRAQGCTTLTANIKVVKEWKKVTICSNEFEVASVHYKPFNEDKSYRYVVGSEANKTNQIDVF